jgi:hypothetical protein
VEAIDPSIPGGRRIVSGRAFVGGQTYGSTNQLETWVEAENAETLVAVDPRGLGFPGTQTGFTGASLLVEPDAFVFVPDADGDLSTHETFPANAQIRVVIRKQVRAASGEFLATPGIASSTVGLDRVEPEVLRHRDLSAAILPANGATGVRSGDERADPLQRADPAAHRRSAREHPERALELRRARLRPGRLSGVRCPSRCGRSRCSTSRPT